MTNETYERIMDIVGSMVLWKFAGITMDKGDTYKIYLEGVGLRKTECHIIISKDYVFYTIPFDLKGSYKDELNDVANEISKILKENKPMTKYERFIANEFARLFLKDAVKGDKFELAFREDVPLLKLIYVESEYSDGVINMNLEAELKTELILKDPNRIVADDFRKDLESLVEHIIDLEDGIKDLKDNMQDIAKEAVEKAFEESSKDNIQKDSNLLVRRDFQYNTSNELKARFIAKKPSFDPKDFRFNTYTEAANVKSSLLEDADRFGFAGLAIFKTLCNKDVELNDYLFGWTKEDIKNSKILPGHPSHRVFDWYWYIDLPEPKEIKKKEAESKSQDIRFDYRCRYNAPKTPVKETFDPKDYVFTYSEAVKAKDALISDIKIHGYASLAALKEMLHFDIRWSDYSKGWDKKDNLSDAKIKMTCRGWYIDLPEPKEIKEEEEEEEEYEFDSRDIVFFDRGLAEKAFDDLLTFIRIHGEVSVFDFINIAKLGPSRNDIDKDYGWKDIDRSTCYVRYGYNGWRIVLPKPERLAK